ncbi:MAG: hypothetical protein JWR74_2777 [Polaromonas sp.]|nr:hypothetical protein [Polaromonas sp.]
MNNFNPREVLAAAADSIALALGASVNHPHPLALQLSLREIAQAAGVLARPGQAGQDKRSVMALGLAIGDFSKALSEGAQVLTVRTYQAQAQHLKFCSVVEVKNFRPADLPALDADIALEPLGENAEITQSLGLAAAGASQARLTTYAKIIGLSRQAIINDDLGGFTRALVELGASAARLEARLVAAALESNPMLDDGAAVFHENYGNVIFDNTFDMGGAMAKLRNQATAAGVKADLAAKHLVVCPELEYTARAFIQKIGLDIQVSALAYLPATRWYLLADTQINPVIGTLRLKNAASAVRVIEQRRRPDGIDGSAVKVVADLGACLLSRAGIVRGGL